MSVQNEGSPPSVLCGGKNENAYSNWASKMRGYPERILKRKNGNAFSKWVFKMTGRPERIFKGGKGKRF